MLKYIKCENYGRCLNMKLKLIKFLTIIMLIILGGLMFAQDGYIVKIMDRKIDPNVEVTIYEDEIVTFIENYSLFNSLFPNPIGFRMPMTEEVFQFESNIAKNLKNAETREIWIEDYISAKLFYIEANLQNKKAKKEKDQVYSENNLNNRKKQFEDYLKLKIPERVYLINVLLEKIKKNPTEKEKRNGIIELKKSYADQWHTQLSNMPQLKQVPQNKIRELAESFAKEKQAEEILEKEIKKIRGSKSIRKGRNDPFNVEIDSVQEFTEEDVEKAFKGYLNLTIYIYMGGMGEEGYNELLNNKDTKEMFIDEYIGYHLLKKKMEKEGQYDKRIINNYIKRCTNYFNMNFINIKYTLKYILPMVQEKVTPDVLKSVITKLENSDEYSGYIDQNTRKLDPSQKEEWLEQFAQRLIYQNLVLNLKGEEVERLRDAYVIETNY